jgi:hypothetical protein
METFHATKRSDLTIMVDDLGMIATYEHCLCTMFTFQLGSLHIFEDVLYDPNNFVSKFSVPDSYNLLTGETMGGWLWPLSHCW